MVNQNLGYMSDANKVNIEINPAGILGGMEELWRTLKEGKE